MNTKRAYKRKSYINKTKIYDFPTFYAKSSFKNISLQAIYPMKPHVNQDHIRY